MTEDPFPAIKTLLRETRMTVVYIAEGPSGEAMVVKRLGADAASDPIGTRRFARERHFAEMLRHPSLPKPVTAGEGWFATEYLPRSITMPGVRENILASGGTGRLLHRLAEALAYVHARGIIHRDVKPGHVMLRGDMPVLIDFGIAALRSDDALSPMEFAGSPAWMAPEQISLNASGPEADIWSFGLTALWLLNGQRAYPGAPEDVLKARRAGAAPQIDWQSAEKAGGQDLATVVRECLGEPQARPDAAFLTRLIR